MVYRYKFIVLLIIISAISTILLGCSSNENRAPLASKGVLDLRDWNFQNDEMATLNGEWEFYWGQLLEPKHFASSDVFENPLYFHFPSGWDTGNHNNNIFDRHGFATYRLQILINENEVGSMKAFQIPYIFSSYRFFVNGELLALNGTVSTEMEKEVPLLVPKVVFYSPKSNIIEIVIQNSNHNHYSGGIGRNIFLGNPTDISSIRDNQVAKDLFLSGSLLIMGLYHLILFLLRRKNRAPLYFGVFCILISVRTLLLGEAYFIHLFPDFSWKVRLQLVHFVHIIGIPTFMLFMQSLYPKEVNKIFTQLAVVLASIYVLIIFILPAQIFTYALISYDFVTLIYICIAIYVLIRAIRNKREGALITSVAFVILALTIVNDVLLYNKYIETFDMAGIGLLIFVFSQAFILSTKFSNAFNQLEELSEKQKMWHEDLEKRVEERTEELQEAMRHLKVTQKQLVESEKMSALGSLVAGVAHEINTPLGIGITASSHLKEKQEEFSKKYKANQVRRSDMEKFLNILEESTNILEPNLHRASELIKSFKQVAVDQSSVAKRKFHLKEYIEEILLSLKPKLKRTKIHVEIVCDEQIEVNSDPGALAQIITNLVVNSTIHGFDKDEPGIIQIKATLHENNISIIYSDNGKGMSQEVKERVFDPFYTTTRGQGGSGLGMHIVYNIVTQSLNGEIRCESEPGKGTMFYITFPSS